MKRIDSFLSENEVVYCAAKPYLLKLLLLSRGVLLGIFLLIGIAVGKVVMNFNLLFIFIPLVIILLGLIPEYIRYQFTNYYITSEKIIIETGIIGRDYDIIRLNRIVDVNLDVSVIDTVFGTGDIKLCTSNENEPTVLKDIKRPREIIQKIKF